MVIFQGAVGLVGPATSVSLVVMAAEVDDDEPIDEVDVIDELRFGGLPRRGFTWASAALLGSPPLACFFFSGLGL